MKSINVTFTPKAREELAKLLEGKHKLKMQFFNLGVGAMRVIDEALPDCEAILLAFSQGKEVE